MQPVRWDPGALHAAELGISCERQRHSFPSHERQGLEVEAVGAAHCWMTLERSDVGEGAPANRFERNERADGARAVAFDKTLGCRGHPTRRGELLRQVLYEETTYIRFVSADNAARTSRAPRRRILLQAWVNIYQVGCRADEITWSPAPQACEGWTLALFLLSQCIRVCSRSSERFRFDEAHEDLWCAFK